MSKDAGILEKWAHYWKMVFNLNLDKQAKELYFSPKQIFPKQATQF